MIEITSWPMKPIQSYIQDWPLWSRSNWSLLRHQTSHTDWPCPRSSRGGWPSPWSSWCRRRCWCRPPAPPPGHSPRPSSLGRPESSCSGRLRRLRRHGVMTSSQGDITWRGADQRPPSVPRAGVLPRLSPRTQPAGVEPEPDKGQVSHGETTVRCHLLPSPSCLSASWQVWGPTMGTSTSWRTAWSSPAAMKASWPQPVTQHRVPGGGSSCGSGRQTGDTWGAASQSRLTASLSTARSLWSEPAKNLSWRKMSLKMANITKSPDCGKY